LNFVYNMVIFKNTIIGTFPYSSQNSFTYNILFSLFVFNDSFITLLHINYFLITFFINLYFWKNKIEKRFGPFSQELWKMTYKCG